MKKSEVYPIFECSKCGRRHFDTMRDAIDCCGYSAHVFRWSIYGVPIEFSTIHEAYAWIEINEEDEK